MRRMRKIKSDDLPFLDTMSTLQVYNGLDCCITAELRDQIRPMLTPDTSRIYKFSLALQAPLLEMMLRGIPIDRHEQGLMLSKLKKEEVRAREILDRIAMEVWNKPLNPNSFKQLKEFFYSALNIPAIESFKKGERKISVDRDALEKLQAYTFAKLPSRCIIAAREAGKKRSVLEAGVSSDGRMRTSYNIGGTETGRLSSSENAFGEGTNHQNITEELRKIFIAPKGMKLAVIDKEQAESRIVGLLCGLTVGDWSYLDACESGDLHTTVSKMVWPELSWPGDPKGDKALASGELFYRHHSYRDMSKRGGHGTNYYGKPGMIATHINVEPAVVSRFQERYFAAFPGIPEWHQWTKITLQQHGVLYTPLGRRRQFFGRLNDDVTLREAIAHIPQSFQVDDINYGLLRAWTNKVPVHWFAQLHDAVMFAYKEEDEEEVLPLVCEKLVFNYTFNSRQFSIPVEPKVGWNWGDYPKKNKDGTWKGDNWDGLRVWTGKDDRTRKVEPDAPLLDRCL